MRLGSLFAIALVLPLSAFGLTLYSLNPDWVSSDSAYGTGGALVDLNRDGWLDLVVANGNDMAKERLVVFYGKAGGSFPALPDWQSADTMYNGHLDVADINGDGWLDVAVATLGNGSSFGPCARVYLNNGAGTLSSTPAWSASEIVPAFGVALGDVNGDGRPDLAVATGWSYGTPHQYYNYVYVNSGGTYPTTASWKSADKWDYQGMLWVDADGDGYLDLAAFGTKVQTRIYRNLGGTLETTSSWATTDSPNQDAIMGTAGDVTGDGLRDLFVTDNTQIGGSGRFRQYDGKSPGMFAQTYSWSYFDGYGSAVALADVNDDGLLDLATGAWWDKTRLFLNTGTGLSTTPAWSSNPDTVVEKICFGDLDKNGLVTAKEIFPTAPASPQVLYLKHQPIQELVQIDRISGGGILPPDKYTCSREHGWISVFPEPGYIEVTYTYSRRLDMAVTTWDAIGNLVFYNKLPAPGDLNCDGKLDAFDIDPFVLALTDPAGYALAWPNCDYLLADMNDDGKVDAFDIDPFVAALTF